MVNQPESALAGQGDSIQEVKITEKNANVPDNTKAKKEAIEKELRQKINQYLESKRAITSVETKDKTNKSNVVAAFTNVETKYETNKSNLVAAKQTKKDVPRKPCDHFNLFGTCKYESGHFSQAGDLCLIHICRYCHDSSGKSEPHPATLCANLKTRGALRDLGESLKIDDLNKDIMEHGTEKVLGEEIAAKLFEPKVDMIVGVVEVIGRAAALENFTKTQEVESGGGMMVFNGARRRTPGGTFLQLLRENTNIDQEKLANFLNRFNGVHVAMIRRKEEINTLLGQSSSLRQNASLKSFGKSCCNNDRLNLKTNCGECKDSLHENVFMKPRPNVIIKSPSSEIMKQSSKENMKPLSNEIMKAQSLSNEITKPLSNEVMKPLSNEVMKPLSNEVMKPLSNGIMNGVISNSVYIPKPRAGSVISSPGAMTKKSTARSRLVPSRGDYGKSTPKSRLSASMENYMGNVGGRRDGSASMENYMGNVGGRRDGSASMENYMGNVGARRDGSASMGNYTGNVVAKRGGEESNEIFPYVGKTQDAIGTRGYRVAQTDNSIRKDRKQNSRKSSIDQIIGCLNQLKNEPFKTNHGQVNGNDSINSQTSQTKKSSVYTEAANQVPLVKGKTPFPMTASFRNEPWLAAYKVAKQKAVHNLESGNLQSVSGISGYCGEVTNASHLITSNSQIQKLMSKMKMEGRQETGNKNEVKRKDWQQLEPKFELNPKAAPFNPSVSMPPTPPMVKLHYSSINESRKIKEGKIGLSRTKNKPQGSLQKLAIPRPRRSEKLYKYDDKPKSGAVKERSKNHCPCPPYCPTCLENMKDNV